MGEAGFPVDSRLQCLLVLVSARLHLRGPAPRAHGPRPAVAGLAMEPPTALRLRGFGQARAGDLHAADPDRLWMGACYGIFIAGFGLPPALLVALRPADHALRHSLLRRGLLPVARRRIGAGLRAQLQGKHPALCQGLPGLPDSRGVHRRRQLDHHGVFLHDSLRCGVRSLPRRHVVWPHLRRVGRSGKVAGQTAAGGLCWRNGSRRTPCDGALTSRTGARGKSRARSGR